MAMSVDEPNDPTAPRAAMMLAYFFIALPEPLSLPHGWTGEFAQLDLEGLVNGESAEADPLRVSPFSRLSASLAVHQLPEEAPAASVDSSMRAVASAFQWSDREPTTRRRPFEASVARTVLEVMIPVSDDTEMQLSGAFEKAVDHCEQLLRTYYMVTQHAVPFLTKARLPPVIPCGVRRAEVGETRPRWPAREDLKLRINPASADMALPPPVLSEAKMEAMGVAGLAPPRGPFASMLDMRRELVLASRTGGTVPAAILCGASAEVLFRELLMMLLWEEGRQPGWAVTAVSQHSVARLVHSQFHTRISGAWSRDSKGVIAEWVHDIADLRNRAVHVGFVPSRAQIERALKTYDSVERFVGDRLAESLQSFPLTAMTFLGTPGAERRGVTQRLNRRLENDIHPADVSASFERWRREVERCASDGPWTGDVTRAAPMLVLYIDGREQWWLMDDHVGLCCLAEPPDMYDHQSANVELLRSELRNATGHVSIRVAGKARPLESQPKWIPTAEAIPSNEYSRFPLSLLPPPTAQRPG